MCHDQSEQIRVGETRSDDNIQYPTSPISVDGSVILLRVDRLIVVSKPNEGGRVALSFRTHSMSPPPLYHSLLD